MPYCNLVKVRILSLINYVRLYIALKNRLFGKAVGRYDLRVTFAHVYSFFG